MATFAEIYRIDRSPYGRVTRIRTEASIPPDTSQRLYVDIAGINPVPAVWDYYEPGVGFSSTLPGPVPGRFLDPGRLWFEHVTGDERGKIFALADADGGGITLTMIQRGRLKAFLAWNIVNPLPRDFPEAIFIFSALETAGAIGPGRAAEILA